MKCRSAVDRGLGIRSRRRGLLPVGFVLLLGGCSLDSVTAFFPAGVVGDHQRNLMILTFVLMLFVFIPVVTLTLFFAWRYRLSNSNARYTPRWSESMLVEIFLWGGPVVIVAILAVVTWVSTHQLDPYRTITVKDRQPIEVDAIALDWKWLFVYPQYNVAAVNEMAMPVNTPVSIHLTSDTVMTSFMIPRLGSQIFAMSGMQTRLHLLPTKTGTFFGKNYQYSGEGFSHMTFNAISTTEQGFKAWVARARVSGSALDVPRYTELEKPSENAAVRYYSPVKPNLFAHVIQQYHSGKPHNPVTPAQKHDGPHEIAVSESR
ncbi:MAG: ubiquinol oxidase subunit II [Salinisphaera sp.]|jgi:cytochrome o ubiquinol oxidase subunit 2|nr:ubiquinol oxidase subunit II [Salinisphaera sp.]